MIAPAFTAHPFLLTSQDVAKQIETDVDKGLTESQVADRQATYGLNELEVEKPTPWYSILIKQFCNAMILVLFIILGVSFGIGDEIEGGVVAAVIVINVSIGFYQESRAEKKMDALRSLSSPSATVLRDGHSHVIPNAEVVPGDIVILRTGDTVPADLRLFESVNLSCDEQMMTGESLPVEKVTHNRIIDPTSPSHAVATSEETVTDGDRINLAFASTNVTKGRGRGIVIATGMSTAVGRIAAAASGKKGGPNRSMNVRKYGPKKAVVGGAHRLGDLAMRLIGLKDVTPLQRRLTYLAYSLFVLAVVIALIVFGVHKFDLNSEVVLYATSTGIALIPESLSIVLIMTMVQATRTMRQANVVVRDLAALELLGGVTNICSDKTGTLTQGAMIVKKAWLPLFKSTKSKVTSVLTLRGATDPNDPTAGKVVTEQQEQQPTEGQQPQRQTTLQIQAPPKHMGEEPSAATAGDGVVAEAEDNQSQAELTPALRKYLMTCALCNIATVRQDPETGEWQSVGEPTEIALQVFAKRFGLSKRTLEEAGWIQRSEFPFDSTVKRMSVVYDAPENDGGLSGLPPHNNGNSIVLTKGAVERILERCSSVNTSAPGVELSESASSDPEEEVPMTEAYKENILNQMNTFAPLGLRVLAIAYRPWNGIFDTGADEKARRESYIGSVNEDVEGNEAENSGNNEKNGESSEPLKNSEQLLRDDVERDLVFLGLVGIYDPPREETAQSIRECTDAGINVHMLTGDHPATAEAIAREVGILPRGYQGSPAAAAATGQTSLVLPATAFDAMSDAELDALPQLPLVVARCTPETKTRMIEALRRRRAFMAMTGDGVNDAPSLRRADVGIAMGSGSDVAKGAAALVLTDDRFSSIVAAVREGRRMFDNIQKFMMHLLVSNIAEVILLIIGLSFKDDAGFSVFPVSALHILWINIFTSAAPALGLGMEKASLSVMHRPPHGRGIFTTELVVDMLIYGVVMGSVSLLTFVTVVYGKNGGQLGHDCNKHWSDGCMAVFRARATVFVQLTYLILFSAWEFKDMRRSLFRLNPENPHSFPMNVVTDLWANKFLFFSVVVGLLPPVILVYVPAIGEKVLKHKPISWEWGLVFAGILIFILVVEGWKYTKRSLGLFATGFGDDRDEEGRRLPRMQKSLTMSTMQSTGTVSAV